MANSDKYLYVFHDGNNSNYDHFVSISMGIKKCFQIFYLVAFFFDRFYDCFAVWTGFVSYKPFGYAVFMEQVFAFQIYMSCYTNRFFLKLSSLNFFLEVLTSRSVEPWWVLQYFNK